MRGPSGSGIRSLHTRVATEDVLDDSGELIRPGELLETTSRVVDQHMLARPRCVRTANGFVALGEHRLPDRRLFQCIWVPCVQGDDFEESVHEDGATRGTQDRHPHTILAGIEGGVAFDRRSVDADLMELELGDKPPQTVTYQSRNVSTGRVGMGAPPSPG